VVPSSGLRSPIPWLAYLLRRAPPFGAAARMAAGLTGPTGVVVVTAESLARCRGVDLDGSLSGAFARAHHGEAALLRGRAAALPVAGRRRALAGIWLDRRARAEPGSGSQMQATSGVRPRLCRWSRTSST
jgi:hypothetical protein